LSRKRTTTGPPSQAFANTPTLITSLEQDDGKLFAGGLDNLCKGRDRDHAAQAWCGSGASFYAIKEYVLLDFRTSFPESHGAFPWAHIAAARSLTIPRASKAALQWWLYYAIIFLGQIRYDETAKQRMFTILYTSRINGSFTFAMSKFFSREEKEMIKHFSKKKTQILIFFLFSSDIQIPFILSNILISSPGVSQPSHRFPRRTGHHGVWVFFVLHRPFNRS
jgi:hypothetical protein